MRDQKINFRIQKNRNLFFSKIPQISKPLDLLAQLNCRDSIQYLTDLNPKNIIIESKFLELHVKSNEL